MRAAAPGKLVLTGAYAVLEGAPAIVIAIDRFAVADGASVDPEPSREIRAAFSHPQPTDAAPVVDVSALYEGDRKLGLGSSAAALVAAIAVRAFERGDFDLDAVYARALEAHARAQGGGSGADVAASTFGGALRHRVRARPEPVALPVAFRAFVSSTAARTSDFIARARGADMGPLKVAAEEASRAIDRADASALLAAARDTERALEALGRAIDLPIVPPAFASLARAAEAEDAAFLPSGAGGGDVGVWLGRGAPSDAFARAAHASGLRAIHLELEPRGVRALS